ncbi:MAG TPA: HlyD family type I secretion periplasmic adaptor subunit [Cyanobacteria bacterium UBA9971]|nr:HlyD family type I secretion periplasmic adaptor subunit [Cyanobacteria bacterium UBA9971]
MIIKKIKELINKDDSHEFKPTLSEIEDNPVSPLGLFTFWTIVALIIITVLWLIIGKVDVVVSARGIVIPDGEVKIIQPLDTGSIRQILVKEGDFVKAGQTLMEIDPSSTEPALESSKENQQNIRLEIKRLNAQANGRSFISTGGSDTAATQNELYSSSISSLNEQLKAKQEDLKSTEEEIKSAQTEQVNYQNLLNTSLEREVRLKKVIDIISKDEYTKEVNNIQSYRTEIDKLKYKLQQLSYKKLQLNNEIAYTKQNFKSETLKELADKQKQEIQIKSEVEQIEFKNKKQSITSPVDGYVDKLLIHTIGGVVTPAEKLISITPSNTPLLIKATVLNQDIGFVKEKMPVQIKIDTFSFQKYGLLKGVVKSVSKSSIQDEKLGPVYEIYVTPLEQTLIVEGKKEKITPGMSLSAEVKVGKRRIIEFFIYPLIKYLNEGISVR